MISKSRRCYTIYISICLTEGELVFAGRPGKPRKSLVPTTAVDSCVRDWNTCVKNLTVSSREGQAQKLVDGSSGFWQSSGSQGKVCHPIMN